MDVHEVARFLELKDGLCDVEATQVQGPSSNPFPLLPTHPLHACYSQSSMSLIPRWEYLIAGGGV